MGSISDFSSSETFTDISGTFTTTGSSTGRDVDGYRRIAGLLNITAVSGTTPTLYLELQESNDNSNWTVVGSYAIASATGMQTLVNHVINARYYRYSYTIAGTNPSFTFSVISCLKHGGSGGFFTMNKYSGVVTTAAGNVSDTFFSRGCSNVSVIVVRGSDAGGSLKFRGDVSNDNVNWVESTGDINVAAGTGTMGNNVVSQTFAAASGYRFYRLRVTDDTSVAATINLFWSATGAT